MTFATIPLTIIEVEMTGYVDTKEYRIQTISSGCYTVTTK